MVEDVPVLSRFRLVVNDCLECCGIIGRLILV